MILKDYQNKSINAFSRQTLNKIIIGPFGGFCASSVLVLVYFWDTFYSMVDKWLTSGTYAHGFMILPICIWLCWLKREQLTITPIKYSWTGLVPVIGFLLLWHIGEIGHILIVQQISVVSLIVAFVYMFFGIHVCKVLSFPLAYLYFSIPFGHFLVAPLQDITAYLTVKGLELSGIPIFVEGWHITTTRGSFEVAQACSGIRYMIAAIALGVLYSYFAFQSYLRRAIFISLCVLVPILANGIRAYGIVLLAHITHMKLAVGVDHLIYGWLFFGITMFLLFWVSGFIKEKHTTPSKSVKVYTSEMLQFKRVSPAWGLFAIVVVFLIGLQWYFAQMNNRALSTTPPIAFAPKSWKQIEKSKTDWHPTFIGANETKLLHFLDENHREIDLFYARYFQERQGQELISATNHMFDEKIWHIANKQTRTIKFQNQKLICMEYDLFNHFGRRLVWTWYQVNDTASYHPMLSKLLILYYKITGQLQAPMVIAMSIPYQYYPDQARLKLDNFANQLKFAQDKVQARATQKIDQPTRG